MDESVWDLRGEWVIIERFKAVLSSFKMRFGDGGKSL
jgi:hypothetical protein